MSMAKNASHQWSWRLRAIAVMVVVLLATILSGELRRRQRQRQEIPIIGASPYNYNKYSDHIGILMTYPTEEQALLLSGVFTPTSHFPSWLDLSGRRFNIGKIKDIDVIYVMSGEQTLNAGITVQILVDVFNVKGIVHYGIAGSANDSLSIGDVSIPKYVAFTGSWKWKEYRSKEGDLPGLRFGAYNVPKKGENLLAKIDFMPQQLYSSTRQSMQEIFWLPIDPIWFNVAAQLMDLKLRQCVNDTYCLPKKPRVVHGLRGSTADIFVDNVAFREFLFKEFNVSTVDEESSAVVMTCLTNGVPCIVFRGLSDFAGGEQKLKEPTFSFLAAVNAASVAVEFIGLIGKGNANPNPNPDH